LTILLSKARKQSTMNVLSHEEIEEMDQSNFLGMTEDEIEEEQKEYVQ
jgi:hypothetical protein